MNDDRITLKMARIGADLTQGDVADQLGININTYSKWEKDPGMISIRDAYKICKIVGAKFDKINFIADEV